MGKLLLDGYLDEVVCLEIYCSSGLIHDQNLGFPKQSPGQAQQLPLPYAAANGKDRALARRTKEQAGVGCGDSFPIPDQTLRTCIPKSPQNALASSTSYSLLPRAIFPNLSQLIRRPTTGTSFKSPWCGPRSTQRMGRSHGTCIFNKHPGDFRV